MNGKLHSETPRTIDNRVLRAILLHHSSADDHIRPVLILTDGSQGFELEPKDAVVKGGKISKGIFNLAPSSKYRTKSQTLKLKYSEKATKNLVQSSSRFGRYLVMVWTLPTK